MAVLKSIEVVFENCEVIELFYPDISFLQIHDISVSYGNYSNCISKHLTIDGFEMFINADAKINHLQKELFKNSTLERFKLCDITQLDIKWDDGTNDYYFVRWVGDEYTHENQKVITTKSGGLYISSYANKKIEISDEDLELLDASCNLKKT